MAEALLAGDEYADAVRADEKLAREAGVTAVPFTVLGARLAIPGTATASAYADAINQALTTGDPQGTRREPAQAHHPGPPHRRGLRPRHRHRQSPAAQVPSPDTAPATGAVPGTEETPGA